MILHNLLRDKAGIKMEFIEFKLYKENNVQMKREKWKVFKSMEGLISNSSTLNDIISIFLYVYNKWTLITLFKFGMHIYLKVIKVYYFSFKWVLIPCRKGPGWNNRAK